MLNGNPLTDFKITFIISSFFHHIYVFFKPFVPEIWYKQSKVRFFLARKLQIIYRRALKTILELFLNLTFYKWVVKKSFQCISKSDNWIYCNQYEFFQNLAKINTRKPFKIKSCFSMKYTEKKAIKIDILLARECISKHEEIRYLRFLNVWKCFKGSCLECFNKYTF